MTKIKAADLIADFQRMYREKWSYVWGKAETGCVDCSGAFVWAYRKRGLSIYHGSNRIARQYVVELLPVSEAQPGMAAFKLRKPGAKGYALGSGYQKGGASYNGDLNDYYHIGLVDEGGQYVLNAQGERSGFTRTKLSTWGAVGYLKAVDYGKGEEPMTTMTEMIVKSDNGGSVRLRKAASTDAAVVCMVPSGATVTAGADADGWRPVIYGTQQGYMMAKYLTQAATSTDLTEETAYVRTLTTGEHSELCALRDQLAAGVALLKRIVGEG